MPRPLLLASSSSVRLSLLRSAGLDVVSAAPRIDEEMIRLALEAENATPRDIADALAEMKAARLSDRDPAGLVLGCDQVLEFQRSAMAKPETVDVARAQLLRLRGQSHKLLSAAVLYDQGQPIWRYVGEARLTMRSFSNTFLDAYLDRNWPAIGQSVGGYKLEEEGIRLFDRIDGDYFTILGLPLLPLLSYLGERGFIES